MGINFLVQTLGIERVRFCEMLNVLLTVLSQEPPAPILDDIPNILPSPMILIAIAVVIAGLVAWKYKAYLEFAAIICSVIGGFIVGLILTPPYANIGLGIMVSLAALFLTTAIVIIIKLAKKYLLKSRNKSLHNNKKPIRI